ncbi:hypothetical protein TWF730_000495 [Orbilia blumenaviensis]|uniref:Inheritance of peroxisomes protein 1 n=1 Tax=Orbilia blumenaviensis TaxID=1796055 RepID=A0AAV9VP04_9PEZI
MALPFKSSGSLSLPRRDGSRKESVSPFAGRRESINPFASKREGGSPLATRRESVAPFPSLNRRESTVGLSRRESSAPFPSLRRASTIGHVPTGAYSNIPGGRKFSVSAIYTGGDVSPIEPPGGNNDDVEVLFHHPTRIVSFTISEEKLKGKDSIASYMQPTERTLSSGPMKIYRVKFSTAFLQGGQLLQPLLPRSACWCMDERRGIFVLRIRKDNYYRLELQDLVEDDLSKVHSLRTVLDKLIVFEKTNCPFRSEKQDVEEPAPLAVFRRSSSVASRPSRPSSAQSDYGAPDNDSGSDIVFRDPGFNAPPKVAVEAPPSMPVMFRKNIFEDKPMLRVPRLQVPQQHNLSASPRALSPLAGRSPLSRNRSISPLARELPNDMFMIPEDGPGLPHTDDEGISVQSVGSGPPSPRYIPRSVPSDYGTSGPSDYADSAASATSSPIDPFSLSYSIPEARGRSPERKPMMPIVPPMTFSPPPTAISPPPTAPMHFLRPPSVVVQHADATESEIDLLDLDIRRSPSPSVYSMYTEEEEKPKPKSKPQPLELEQPREDFRMEHLVQLQIRDDFEDETHEVPSIFEPLQSTQETALPQIRPQTPLPSPPATPPLSHSASDSESEENIEAITPEVSFRHRATGDISNVSLLGTSQPMADTSSMVIEDNGLDASSIITRDINLDASSVLVQDSRLDASSVVIPASHMHMDTSSVTLQGDHLDNSSVIIRDNDPDTMDMDTMAMDDLEFLDPLAGLNMSLIPRANEMPVTKTPGSDGYEPLSRTGRRFIRSMDHEAVRGIFGKTVNVKIHQPSGFLLKFMLRVADKLMKGAKIYVYYWGDWKKGKVKGKGGRVKESGSVDLTDSSPISPQDYEKVGLLSDEDDYGVKISNETTPPTTGRKRRPFSFGRRDSV